MHLCTCHECIKEHNQLTRSYVLRKQPTSRSCPPSIPSLSVTSQVIKKHDKLTSSCLKESYWQLIEERYPESRKDKLQRGLERLEDLYAILFADGDLDAARTALSQNLRQHIQVLDIWGLLITHACSLLLLRGLPGPQAGTCSTSPVQPGHALLAAPPMPAEFAMEVWLPCPGCRGLLGAASSGALLALELMLLSMRLVGEPSTPRTCLLRPSSPQIN